MRKKWNRKQIYLCKLCCHHLVKSRKSVLKIKNNYMCTCPKPANSQVNSGVKRSRFPNRQTNEKRRVYRKSAFLSKRIWYPSELYNTPILYFLLISSETIEYLRRNSTINTPKDKLYADRTQKNFQIKIYYKTTVKRAEINHSVKENPYTQTWIQSLFPPYWLWPNGKS